jgi:transcriptional regulator GlxA family with amidase domain
MNYITHSHMFHVSALNKPRQVAMLAFPNAKLLDVSGPIDMFATALDLLATTQPGPPFFTVEVIAEAPDCVTTSSGVRIMVDRRLQDVDLDRLDTLMVAGGLGVEALLHHSALLQWLAAAAQRVRRVGSVCTGAFLLAAAGLLDGRRATTHWRHTARLAQGFPAVCVEPDAIFVKDGHIYTSAGVTAGMDLALALIEEDLGRDIALAVARDCVMFLKRPGGQSQFSSYLMLQHSSDSSMCELQGWILDHLDADLSVGALAARVAMSPRNFARVFKREVRTTPARFVEMARLQAARQQLETSHVPIEAVAHDCGFGNPEHLRRAFMRQYRISPQSYRQRFQA